MIEVIAFLMCVIAAALIVIIALMYDIYQLLRHGK